MEASDLGHEFNTIESDIEEESGKDKAHGAHDNDAYDAGGEAMDAGLQLGFQIPWTCCGFVIGSRTA